MPFLRQLSVCESRWQCTDLSRESRTGHLQLKKQLVGGNQSKPLEVAMQLLACFQDHSTGLFPASLASACFREQITDFPRDCREKCIECLLQGYLVQKEQFRLEVEACHRRHCGTTKSSFAEFLHRRLETGRNGTGENTAGGNTTRETRGWANPRRDLREQGLHPTHQPPAAS